MINIDVYLTDTSDEYGFRSYHLTAYGTSLVDLLDTATITACDEDGGEIDTVELSDADPEIMALAFSEIELAIRTDELNAVRELVRA